MLWRFFLRLFELVSFRGGRPETGQLLRQSQELSGNNGIRVVGKRQRAFSQQLAQCLFSLIHD